MINQKVDKFMSNSKSITAVVVTYNRLKMLQECIPALLTQSQQLNKLVVVNNHSNDGTEEYLMDIDDKRLLVFNLDDNLGGAGGFEFGIKQAVEHADSDYIWFMDDDTIPTENASTNLLIAAHKLNDEFGFLCSNVRWTDGSSTNIPKVHDKWPEKVLYNLIRVTEATFVSVMVKRESIIEFGLPGADFVIWGDDTEYTVRLSQKSASYFVEDSIVQHKTVNNLANDTLEEIAVNRINRYYYMYRNLIYITRKYQGSVKMWKRVLGNAKDYFKVLFKAHDNRFKRSNAILKGTLSGLIFHPSIKFPKV